MSAVLDGQVRIKEFLKRGTLFKNVYDMPEDDYEAPATVYDVEVDGTKKHFLSSLSTNP